MSRGPSFSQWRALLAPGLASLLALAVLLTLGFWQLERKAWKESLIAQIETRAFGEPVALPPENEWHSWTAEQQEFRRVRASGTFLHEHEAPIHGLMPAERGSPVQGFYLMTPLRLRDGAIVMVNRGFVPSHLREPSARPESLLEGEVTVTGLMRAPERDGWFVPENDAASNRWFLRDSSAIAAAKGLARVAPFYVEVEASAVPGGWPKGGQSRLNLPNNHLQYALTWFGIALTLVGVFAAFAWRKVRGGDPDPLAQGRTGT